MKADSHLQVLLYALEDFSFADFIHLAVFHKRDMFAASPIGISPRTWNPDSALNPILCTPHQCLTDPDFPAKKHRLMSRASRRYPDGANLALVRGADGKDGVDAEAGVLSLLEVPEMEKWAKLLQSGGLTFVTPMASAVISDYLC